MPRVVDHDQRRRELVEATWAVVAAEGLEAATVRRIAEEAGCTTGRITHYFRDKDEMLVAALRRVHLSAGRRMLTAVEHHSGLAGLRAVLAEALPLDDERLLEWRVWLAFWGNAANSPGLQAEQHDRYVEWRGLLRGLLEAAESGGELAPDTPLDLLVDQLVAVIDGLGLQGILDPLHLPPSLLAERMGRTLDVLLMGSVLNGGAVSGSQADG